MTDKTIPNMGEPPSPDAKRDAIHFAVFPAVAHGRVWAGASVALRTDGKVTTIDDYNSPRCIGIADPFLHSDEGHTTYANDGGRVWVMLKPNTITSLRHEWTHPAFPEETSTDVLVKQAIDVLDGGKAAAYFKDLEIELDMSTNEILDAMTTYINSQGNDRHTLPFDTPTIDAEEFIKNYEIMTGNTVPRAIDSHPFSCSC